MEALAELRGALLADVDPDLRAIARRWALGVDDTELRDAVIQLAVAAAPHLESRLRTEAHRQFDFVLATNNLAPPPPPPSGKPANFSPKWAGRAREKDALNQMYERKYHVPGVGRRKFRALVPEQCWAVALSYHTSAKNLSGKAEYFERLATRMVELGAATVEDLPPEELGGF